MNWIFVSYLSTGLFYQAVNLAFGLNVTDPPQDTVVPVGSSINLTCGTQERYTGLFQWGQYVVSAAEPNTIYYTLDNGSPTYLNPYTASKFPQIGQYGLGINNVQLADGSRYVCRFFINPPQALPVNVLVAAQPTAAVPPAMNIGASVTLTCTISFGGNIVASQSPTLNISIGNRAIDVTVAPLVTTTNGQLVNTWQRVFNYTALASDAGLMFQCTFTTTNPSFSINDSKVLNILVPASVASFSPRQPSYVVGDAITAVVVGYPRPAVQWTAISSPYTGSVPSGPVLNITDKMVGDNVWNCSALNAYGSSSQLITFNVTAKSGPNTGESTSGNGDQALAIGLGVGLGVGIPVLAGVIILIVCCCIRCGCCRRQTKKQTTVKGPPMRADQVDRLAPIYAEVNRLSTSKNAGYADITGVSNSWSTAQTSPNRLNNVLSPKPDPGSPSSKDDSRINGGSSYPTEKRLNTDKSSLQQQQSPPTVQDSNGFTNAVFTFDDDEPKPEQRVRGRRERHRSQDSKNGWQGTMSSNHSTMNRSASVDRLMSNEMSSTRPTAQARIDFTNQLASYQNRPELTSPSLNEFVHDPVPAAQPRNGGGSVSRSPYDYDNKPGAAVAYGNKPAEYVKEMPNYDSYSRRPTDFGAAPTRPSYSGYDGRPITYDRDFPAYANDVQSAAPSMQYAADSLPNSRYQNPGSFDRYGNVPGQYDYDRIGSPSQYAADRAPYDRLFDSSNDRGNQLPPQLTVQRPDLSFDLASRPTSRSDRQPAAVGVYPPAYGSVDDNYDYDRVGGDRAYDVGSSVGSPREMSFRSNQMLDILGASASVDV